MKRQKAAKTVCKYAGDGSIIYAVRKTEEEKHVSEDDDQRLRDESEPAPVQ